MNTIYSAWHASHVRRWHANADFCDTVDPNARHQHGVALLLLGLFPTCSRNALIRAITHDQGEELGDLTWGVKQAHPKLAAEHAALETQRRVLLCGPDPEVDAIEADMLHLCDRLDAWLWCARHRPDLLDRSDWQDDARLIRKLAENLRVWPYVLDIFTDARRR